MNFDALFPYFSLLEATNDCLSRVKYFNFYPGMLFGSRTKWWPDSGLRPTMHEGIDICYYTDSAGKERKFTPQTNIPVMASGRIFAICRDFLGRSLFVDHGVYDSMRFLSVYAHIALPRNPIIGQMIQAGDIVGVVADTTGRKNRMPAHVHITLMRLPQTVPADTLDWNYICSSKDIELIDPLSAIHCQAVRTCTENPWKEKEQSTS